MNTLGINEQSGSEVEDAILSEVSAKAMPGNEPMSDQVQHFPAFPWDYPSDLMIGASSAAGPWVGSVVVVCDVAQRDAALAHVQRVAAGIDDAARRQRLIDGIGMFDVNVAQGVDGLFE